MSVTTRGLLPPRSLLAWVGVAALVFIPLMALGAAFDRWSHRVLSDEEYERVARGRFPSKQSGVRGWFIALTTCLLAIVLLLLYLGTEFVGV